MIRALTLAVLCAGCAQTPALSPPTVALAPAFKEGGHPWADTSAGARLPVTAWWRLFDDPDMDPLQRRLMANSPDLAPALARYQAARAATDSLRAAHLPLIGAGVGFQRDGRHAGNPQRASLTPGDGNTASIGLELGHELDLWGRIRQQVRAGVAQEKAAQAGLAAAQLALQAQLADTLVALRGIDAELSLLAETDVAFSPAAELIGRRHQLGAASGLDAARAQVQAESARSDLRQLRAERAVLEHAIAALVGADPSCFTLAAVDAGEPVPTPAVALVVPSALLQRRPDIVAAQQRVAAAAESVGVARTAFFPSIRLGASGGLEGGELSNLFSLPNLFWALGSSLAIDLVDGGRRQAEVARADALLEESGQRYRATVLGALQQVEDQLALLAHYGAARESERLAAASARRAVELATRRYEGGAATYLEVVTAQTASLDARRTSVVLATRHRRAAVGLVRALGGGWSDYAGG